jgi:hypothetical protein
VLSSVDERFAPMQRAELHESLALAFLVLLEQLTPVERAVFLLREVFDYEYAEIAAIVGIGQAFSSGGSWRLAVGALLLGLLVLVVGMTQSRLLVGSFHWVIEVVHLLLGMLAVGVGQSAAAHGRKSSPMPQEQPSRAT